MAVIPVSTSSQIHMRDRSVRFLVGYLIIAAALSFYMVYTLWSAKPGIAAGQVPGLTCAPGASQALTDIYPAQVDVGATTDVLLLGCGFTNPIVKFNTTQHAALL